MLTSIAERLLRTPAKKWNAPAHWSETAYRSRERAEKARWMARMGYW